MLCLSIALHSSPVHPDAALGIALAAQLSPPTAWHNVPLHKTRGTQFYTRQQWEIAVASHSPCPAALSRCNPFPQSQMSERRRRWLSVDVQEYPREPECNAE